MVAEIERGMMTGSTISFPRMSEQKPGQIPGDVIMQVAARVVAVGVVLSVRSFSQVQQKEHSRFVRHENDLHTTIHVTLAQALLGFEYEIEHLDGHMAKVSKKTITKPLEVLHRHLLLNA